MNKVILIPLVASSMLLGCQDQKQTDAKAAIETLAAVPAWVGEFKGTTPCMGCLSRCNDCPGMAVALTLNEDHSFILARESLSGHNNMQKLTGLIKFHNAEKTQLELLTVGTRNLLFVDLKKLQLEIRQDVSAKKHQMQSDFILAKNI